MTQEPSPSGTGSDAGNGSGGRRRFHVRRARRRSRPGQGWRPRLRSAAVETGEKRFGLPRLRISWPSDRACERPEVPDRAIRCSIIMTPTAAQADHY